MKTKDIGAELGALASDYASASEPELQTSARAKLLALIEKLDLDGGELRTERIDPNRLSGDPRLRGAIRAHLDLAFRSAALPAELLGTATRGVCRVAWHSEIADFPLGVALALPAKVLPRSRNELFVDEAVTMAGAPLLVLFAMATNPARLGAGALLVRDLLGDCSQFSPHPRLVAFSPLTGLRARVIRVSGDDAEWSEATGDIDEPDLLRDQVSKILAAEQVALPMEEPVRSWLAEQARIFAHSKSYITGRFHRSQGASLIGIAHGANPTDSDALWASALFDYHS